MVSDASEPKKRRTQGSCDHCRRRKSKGGILILNYHSLIILVRCEYIPTVNQAGTKGLQATVRPPGSVAPIVSRLNQNVPMMRRSR